MKLELVRCNLNKNQLHTIENFIAATTNSVIYHHPAWLNAVSEAKKKWKILASI